MTWTIEFLDEAEKDLKKLDRSVRIQVVKGIRKVSQNPLSVQEGGYGKPLGNKTGNNLTNLLKIKFRDLGIRVVYKTIRLDNIMKIIVISARTDEQVYKEAGRRREKYGL
ncbi:MAG TPA: type II toxin-antitoxin system RelE/ParE family toxin [Candidatus Eisenbergiella merdavium]|uniref:Type II toxin-antitoxin system RelE/ParE family toxin n=1 Tax=Candidatus Eisenbergiella merdavium TaxID=2838551 RepID=A0A9D2NKL5_9FIRM|nr:type II toxin-antitoxin system RelE/ParE family toxin [Candidatus Eisenbergiella merdavium]